MHAGPGRSQPSCAPWSAGEQGTALREHGPPSSATPTTNPPSRRQPDRRTTRACRGHGPALPQDHLGPVVRMMPDPDLAWASHSVLVADEEVRDAFAAATSILGEADLEPPIAVGDNGQDGWAVIARAATASPSWRVPIRRPACRPRRAGPRAGLRAGLSEPAARVSGNAESVGPCAGFATEQSGEPGSGRCRAGAPQGRVRHGRIRRSDGP